MYSVRDHPKVGFPHSEIFGSKPVRGSPKLIAAYHVLHRLLAPRHPPNALLALDQLLHLSKNHRSRGPRLSVPCRGHPPSTELHSHPRGRTTRQHAPRAARRRPRRQDLCFLSTMSQNNARGGLRPRLEPLILSAIASHQNNLVEVNGIEPMTSCLQSRRSPN